MNNKPKKTKTDKRQLDRADSINGNFTSRDSENIQSSAAHKITSQKLKTFIKENHKTLKND